MKEKERLRIFAEKMIEAWSIWLEEAEDEKLLQPQEVEMDMDINKVRNLLAKKVHEGKSEKIREILQGFHVDKLSDLPQTAYKELVHMVEQI